MQQQFSNVPVGAKFFDPYSGEHFIKCCENAAEMVTGGDYFAGFVEFDDSEMVESE